MILLIAFQVITFIAMIAVSVWGMRRVPDDARLRVRAGPTGIDWTISKNTALLLTPVIGLLVVLATLVDSENREAIAALGLAVMVIFALAHLSAIKRAAR